MVSSIQSASGWNEYSISGAPMPTVVVVVGAPERMHAVGTQRHVVRGVGGGAAQRGLQRDRPALDARLVADLDVPARHAGIAAHGAAVFLGGLVVLQHRLDHERGEIALLGVGALAQAREIVVGNLDGRLGHQLLGGVLQGRDGDHGGLGLLGRDLVQQRLARPHDG